MRAPCRCACDLMREERQHAAQPQRPGYQALRVLGGAGQQSSPWPGEAAGGTEVGMRRARQAHRWLADCRPLLHYGQLAPYSSMQLGAVVHVHEHAARRQYPEAHPAPRHLRMLRAQRCKQPSLRGGVPGLWASWACIPRRGTRLRGCRRSRRCLCQVPGRATD